MLKIRASRDYDQWRRQMRKLLAERIPPDEVLWIDWEDEQLTLVEDLDLDVSGARPARVPRAYADLAERVFYHRSPQRFWILYRLLWRITHGERELLQVETDDDVRQAIIMQRQVRNDAHRMTGFVRFEQASDAEGELFVAWYRPDHYVLPLCAGSFIKRLRNQRWSILTPDESATWDRKKLRFGPGVNKRPAGSDQLVALWKTYYANTYNPQRDNPRLFRQHVPIRFLRDMPEATALDEGLKTNHKRHTEYRRG